MGKILDITKGENMEIKMTPRILIALVVILIMAYGAMFLTFVTKAEANEQNQKITLQLNGLTKEVRVGAAYQAIAYYEQKLDRMERNGANTHDIADEEKSLELSENYRDCLVNEKPNCDLIRQQIK